MRALAAALALLALPLAGCLAPTDGGLPAGAAPPAVVDVPRLDAVALLADVKAFSEAYPMRRGDNEAHNAARDDLLARFEAMGHEAVLDEFTAPVSRTATPTNALGSGRLVNVCAFHWGTTRPEEWVFVGAHYDVTDGAWHGAYDDASGTMFVVHLAEAFADVPTARTIVFCAFDGEEQGLQGSRHIVESLANGEWVLNNGTAVGMVDFDMAGITWPAAPPLVADVRSPEMKAAIEASAAAIGFPADRLEYRGIAGGNSDNGPFKAAEIPSVLFISAFDEVAYGPTPGLPSQVTYPFWHKGDTYDGMVALAEGEANLRAGFQNVADIGADLLFVMAGETALTFE